MLPKKQLPSTTGKEAQAALSLAVRRATEFLALPQNVLAEVIGISKPSVSRLMAGNYLLDPARKEWQLAILYVRMFRSLDSLTGGRDELSRAWLTGENRALNAEPLSLITSIEGLVKVVQYLDATRGRV